MGLLDQPLRNVAKTLSNVFVFDAFLFTRKSQLYDPLSGASNQAHHEVYIKTFPPNKVQAEHTIYEITKEDVSIAVPAQNVDDAAFDLRMQSDVKYTVTISNVTYKVIYIKPIIPGDSVTLYILHLRK